MRCLTSYASDRRRVAFDVDGVVADLIPGFCDWFHGKFGVRVDPETIVYHNDMGRSPALEEVDRYLRHFYPAEGADGGWGGAFIEFMNMRDAYPAYVSATPGARDGIDEIKETCDVVFVTALMRRANGHVPGKLDWIGRSFPRTPIFTVPSEYKCWIPCDYAVDDRWDNCERWSVFTDTRVMLFGRPWSEAPDSAEHWDWPKIVKTIARKDAE